MEIIKKIEELEKKCRSLDRQNQLLIEHIKRSDSLIQNQEMRIYKLEKRFLVDDLK